MSEHAGDPRPGVSRREVMRRGAVLGGTLVWAVPVVQTISTSAAHAQVSPPPDVPFDGPSYVAMNVDCGGQKYFVKFDGDDNEFEDSPGNTPGCDPFTPVGTKVNGSTLGMSGSASGDCITINTGSCTVEASAVRKGQACEINPIGGTGSGELEFCS